MSQKGRGPTPRPFSDVALTCGPFMLTGVMKVVLNAGCGTQHVPADRFPAAEWQEIRLDVAGEVEPDIVADIRAIPLEDECLDAVYTSHTLEHLPESGVRQALGEFRRILKPEGQLVIRVPDLAIVAREIVEGRMTEKLYDSAAGPVRPLDMLFGMQVWVDRSEWMGHRMGFTLRSLADMLGEAGLKGQVHSVPEIHELIAQAYKPLPESEDGHHADPARSALAAL